MYIDKSGRPTRTRTGTRHRIKICRDTNFAIGRFDEPKFIFFEKWSGEEESNFRLLAPNQGGYHYHITRMLHMFGIGSTRPL